MFMHITYYVHIHNYYIKEKIMVMPHGHVAVTRAHAHGKDGRKPLALVTANPTTLTNSSKFIYSSTAVYSSITMASQHTFEMTVLQPLLRVHTQRAKDSRAKQTKATRCVSRDRPLCLCPSLSMMMIVYPRETPPHTRTARAQPPAAHRRRQSRPHHRRHGEHSPTARQPHSNGLCSPPKEGPGPGSALRHVDMVASLNGRRIARPCYPLPSSSPLKKISG